MKVLVTGASGLIGSALVASLQRENHSVIRLVRPGTGPGPEEVSWNPESPQMDAARLEGSDAVIHLAGAPMADKRWTLARKQVLRSSRVDATRNLVRVLRQLKQRPSVLVSASAMGYYGDRGDEVLTESSPPGSGFICELVRAWEASALDAEKDGIRVVHLRFSVVLSAKGGALARMLPPFRLGLGGRLGSGKQWMSWIALDDAIAAIHASLVHEQWQGPVNVSSPYPVTNEEFTRILARTIRRPALFPVPRLALRLLFGEIADSLLLASTRLMPEKLIAYRHLFRYPELEPALRAVLRDTPG